MDYRTPSVCPLDGEPCLGYAEALMKNDLLTAERDALAADVERLREALESIRCLDPDTDTDEGYGEAGEAVCYHLARDIADAALAQPPTVSPSAPAVSGDSKLERLMGAIDMCDLAPIRDFGADDWTWAEYHSETIHRHPTVPEFIEELRRRALAKEASHE